MTNKQAIEIIRKEYLCVDRDCDIERSCGKCDLMIPTKEPILEAYKMAISALSDKWIPTSERLPESGKRHDVLVTVRHKNPTYKGFDVCIAEYDARFDDCKWDFVTGWTDDNLYVTAWRPLPDPYGEEG